MYIDKNKNEVTLKKWQWGVIMEDGSQVKQFENGCYTYIGDIDLTKVKIFFLFKGTEMVYKMKVTPDMKIFKYNYITKPYWDLNLDLRTEVFGFKWKGTKNAVYIHILPNDNVIISPTDDVDLIEELKPRGK